MDPFNVSYLFDRNRDQTSIASGKHIRAPDSPTDEISQDWAKHVLPLNSKVQLL